MKFFSVLACSVFLFSIGLSNASRGSNAYLCPMLVFAAGDGNLEYVKHLVEKGAAVNCKHENERPIDSAIKNKHVKIVEYLLEKGAEVDNTELLCWASEHGHLEIVRILIEKRRTDVNKADKLGRTQLFLAYYKNEYCHPNYSIVMLLIEFGANYTELINPKNNFKLHLIELAVCYGDVDLVQFLVDVKQVNVNGLYNGQTLLHISAESPYRSYDSSELHEKVVRFLLSRNANTKIEDINGKTALDVANEKKHHAVAEPYQN